MVMTIDVISVAWLEITGQCVNEVWFEVYNVSRSFAVAGDVAQLRRKPRGKCDVRQKTLEKNTLDLGFLYGAQMRLIMSLLRLLLLWDKSGRSPQIF